jgi:hypothetical protein
MIEVTAAVGLDAIGNDCEQQVSRQMSGRGLLEYALPSRPKSVEVETAQVCDLILNGSFGRGTTIATFLQHRIMPPASRYWRASPFLP